MSDDNKELRQALSEAIQEGGEYAQTLSPDDPLRPILLANGFGNEQFGIALQHARKADAEHDDVRAAHAWVIPTLGILWNSQIVSELAPGEESEQIADLVASGASAQMRVQRWSLARQVLQPLVATYRRLVKVEQQTHLANDLATLLSILGSALANQRRLTEAVTVFEEARDIYSRQIEIEVEVEVQDYLAEGLAMVLDNLGKALATQQSFAQAVVARERARDIYRCLIKDKHQAHLAKDLAAVLNNLGFDLASLQRLAEAVAAFKEERDIYRRLLEDECQAHLINDLDGHLASVLNNLGHALFNQQLPVEGMEALEEARDIYRRLVDFEQNDDFAEGLANVLNNLGCALSDQQRPAEAVTANEEALEIFRRLAKFDRQAHMAKDIARVLNDLGVSLRKHHRLDESVTVLEESRNIYCRLIEVEHQVRLANVLAKVLNNLGFGLAAQQRPSDALAVYVQAGTVLSRISDPDWDTPDICVMLSRNILRTWELSIFEQLAVSESSTDSPPLLPSFSALATAFERAVEFRSIAEMRHSETGVDSAADQFNEFISLWLSAFITTGQWAEAAEVVTRAHGQRLAALQLARLQSRRDDTGLSDRQRLFLDRLAAFHELERRIAPRHTRPDASGPGSVGAGRGHRDGVDDDLGGGGLIASASHSDPLEATRSALLQELRSLRRELIDAGELPDVSQWRLSIQDHLQSLAPGQALGVMVLPAEFGAEGSGAVAVFTQDGYDVAPLQAMPALQARMGELADRLEGRGGVRHSVVSLSAVQSVPTSSSEPAATPDPTLSSDLCADMLADLRASVWNPLSGFITEQGIRELILLPQGEAHVLPWQASAPPGLDVRLFASVHMHKPGAAPVALPSPQTPLYVLANDAAADADPLRRLWYVPLEAQAIELLHAPQDAGAVQRLSHPRHLQRRGLVWAIGHGNHAQGGQAGQAVLACGSAPDEAEVNPNAFVEHGQAMPALVASACLVGRVSDLGHEPMGLPTVLALSEVGLVAGALVSVDDLYATLMAIAVHSHWLAGASERGDSGDLRLAMQQARHSLGSGQWPEHLQQDLRRVIEAGLPQVLREICTTTLAQHAQSRERTFSAGLRLQLGAAVTRQITALSNDWGLCSQGSIASVQALLADLQSSPEAVSEQAFEHLLDHRHQPASLLRAQLISNFLAVFG